MTEISNKEITKIIDNAITFRTETDKVEFKDARGGLPTAKLWRTISSFSHQPGGGYIVFGIKEDRNTNTIEIVGVSNLSELQEQVSNYFRQQMKNFGTYDMRIIPYKEHQLLVLIIDETPDELKPCFHSADGLPNGACIRDGNVDRTITEDEMRRFIRNNSIYKFDKTPAKDTNIGMLSLDKVSLLLQKSSEKVGRKISNDPTPEVMKNLGIVLKVKNDYIPTIGGFLIFSKDIPQQTDLFRRYIVRCVRYQGVSVSSPIIDNQDIIGTLDEQIDQMQTFILRNVTREAEIVGTKRVERYEYPEEAIRELVANAVIHRDYSITETYTQINIFSDRIEILNPGNLPPGITIENIKESQFSRNEIIAAILRDLDYLEEYGRGIDIVFSRMNEWGLLQPIFKNSANSFKVLLLGKPFKSLNPRQVDIWHGIQERGRLTAKDCREMFPDVSKATVSNDIKKLIEIGLIGTEGLSTNTFYLPKY